MKNGLKKTLLFVMIFGIVVTYLEQSVKANRNKKVLILNSYNEGMEWTQDIQKGIEDVLKIDEKTTLYYEFMDIKFKDYKNYIKMIYKLYKEKYKDIKFDVIMCVDNDSLNFMVDFGESIFGKCPVVFCGINDFSYDMLKGKKNFTGVIEKIDVESTIKSILTLQPNTENIAIICDSTTTGKINEKIAIESIKKYEDKIKFYFYKDFIKTDLINKLNKLNKKSVILDIAQLKSDDGRNIPYGRTNSILSKLNHPIYVCWDFLLHGNVLGGNVVSGYAQGKDAAEMVIRIINGKSIKDIPVNTKCESKYIFNYCKLIDNNIDINLIPKDYEVINQPFSLYNSYKIEFFAIFSIIVIQLSLIIILFFNVKKRISTEKELKENYEELNCVYEELAETEEVVAEKYRELQISEERYKLSVDGCNDIIWEYDFKNNKYYISDKLENLIGIKIDVNYSLKDIITKFIIEEDIDRVIEELNNHIHKKSSYFQVECRIKDSFNKLKWVYIRAKALLDKDQQPIKIAGSIADITERKTYEERIQFLAFYDQLTKLPNKHMLLKEFKNKIQKAKNDCSKFAIIFIDVDNFKRVNDTLGHNYGDEFLNCISNRLVNCLKDGDMVGRFGGDEFLILKSNINSNNEIENMSEKILKSIQEPIELNEEIIFTTASMGISMFPKDGTDDSSLLKSADTAMYNAKKCGKNRYLFYDENMSKKLIRKSNIINGLRNVIKDEELLLVFQPQIDLKTNKTIGAEVLLRWKNKKLGCISPKEFIPIAEKTEFIVPIGKWVLKQACLKNKEWLDKGSIPITISVNVSVVQLRQDDFLSSIKQVLQETKLPPKYLELEITESVMINHMEENLNIINEIKSLGVKIALDDFGTGYSSLNYLRLLPIDNLKLDKSFIDHIYENENEASIVDEIIKLAHKMDIKVIVEGVEIEEQLQELKKMDCDIIQGYYISKPIEAMQFENYIFNN